VAEGGLTGKESHKKLDAELSDLWELVERVWSGERILHGGRLWKVRIAITVDLPAGRKIFGFAAYYAPATKGCKCIWCGCTKADLAVFGTPRPLQNWEAVVSKGEQAEKTGKSVGGMEVCNRSRRERDRERETSY